MRLFIGIPVKIPIYSEIKKDFEKWIKGKWVEEFNLHVTLLFIGNGNPEEWKFALPTPIEGRLEIGNLFLLGNRILALKVHHPQLKKWHFFFRERLLVSKSTHPFIPHITLCRLKRVVDYFQLMELIEKWNKELSLKFQREKLKEKIQIYLFSSQLTPTGPRYIPIYHYPTTTFQLE